ncbi:hypothetical protein BCR41DRAFT_398757 [Lobosporangium transversale]|uniref:Uncharacterized protein n=1 Tax=Lobosporangium transversale TaxID=64571 RepID=A0A1Y2GJI0_9FUNG|nr:hypothetical protein BCR41DRAFT_398757 [Lobosporangium transversale]ORZ09315.1 hypothetical protein BCR41DRAFT_398757 [Lobosporangium transversale]|eukprot:XP_021878768.1 hypothetical protein BCR41DRAFT_398757 [Lobosporangium transversale]
MASSFNDELARLGTRRLPSDESIPEGPSYVHNASTASNISITTTSSSANKLSSHSSSNNAAPRYIPSRSNTMETILLMSDSNPSTVAHNSARPTAAQHSSARHSQMMIADGDRNGFNHAYDTLWRLKICHIIFQVIVRRIAEPAVGAAGETRGPHARTAGEARSPYTGDTGEARNTHAGAQATVTSEN